MQTMQRVINPQIVSFVEKINKEWFPSSDDLAWENMVRDLHGADEHTLLVKILCHKNVRRSLKRRALYLFIAPTEDFRCFYWEGKYEHRLSFGGDSFFRNVSKDIAEDAANLLIELIPLLHTVGGGKTWTSTYSTVLSLYNMVIRVLLPLLSEEKADALFALFEMYEWAHDTWHGWKIWTDRYQPLQDLLSDPSVDIKYKKLADQKMRDAILSGSVKDKDYWCVIKHVLDSKTPQPALLPDQIAFLYARQPTLLLHSVLPAVFAVLKGDEYLNIRRGLAKEQKNPRYNDEEWCVVARQVVLDCADEPEFCEIWKAAIQEYESKLATQRAIWKAME